jgi:hypothetical protein
MEELSRECPPGLYRIFLTSTTQQQFNLRADEDVHQDDTIRYIPKQAVMDDIKQKLAVSDFYPYKSLIEEYNEDDILLIYDYEFQYDKNFYICLSSTLRENINNVSLIGFHLFFE